MFSNFIDQISSVRALAKGGALDILSSPYAILAIILVALAVVVVIVAVIIAVKDKKAKLAAAEKEKDAAKQNEADTDAERAPRFCMLTQIDENRARYAERSFDDNVSLRRFCESFRDYAASELKLYYDISDIRRFIAGLAVSPMIILQGMSGTGKTSLAHALGAFLENRSTVIPVQPMWKERTDLLGYYNEFTKRFNETLLLEKMYEANYSEEIYITVLDELNIARVEYYFAEFLSLLELPNPLKSLRP